MTVRDGKGAYEKEGQIGTISSIIGYKQSLGMLTPETAIVVGGIGHGRRLAKWTRS